MPIATVEERRLGITKYLRTFRESEDGRDGYIGYGGRGGREYKLIMDEVVEAGAYSLLSERAVSASLFVSLVMR